MVPAVFHDCRYYVVVAVYEDGGLVFSSAEPFAIHYRMTAGRYRASVLYTEGVQVGGEPVRGVFYVARMRWVTTQTGDSQKFVELVSKSFCMGS
jgi:hypothetical protein